MLSYHLQDFSPPPDVQPRRSFWLRLPFLGRPSTFFAKELERLNYKVGFYPLTKISSLSRLKDRIPKSDRSGIYRLTCGICAAEYIGQTGFRKNSMSTRTILPIYMRVPLRRNALNFLLWPFIATKTVTTLITLKLAYYIEQIVILLE